MASVPPVMVFTTPKIPKATPRNIASALARAAAMASGRVLIGAVGLLALTQSVIRLSP